MKYTTFRGLVIGGVLAAGAGGVLLVSHSCKSDDEQQASKLVAAAQRQPQPQPQPQPRPPTPDPQTQPSPDPNAMRPPDPPAGAIPLRDMDQKILAAAAAGVSGDKAKDAIKGGAYKVNLYRDSGKSAVNRAKVDLDRDEKWDEKWTWDGGAVERQVAPADDEKYTEIYVLSGRAWVKK